MEQTLSELLHAELDKRGAPPRNTQAPIGDADPEMAGTVPDNGEPLETEVGQFGEVPGAETLEQGEEAEPGTTAEEGEGKEGDGEEGAEKHTYSAVELAAAIGWEAEDLYNDLVVPFANGESKTLGELKDGWEDVSRQQAEVQQAREQIQQQQQALQAQQQQLLSGQKQQSEELDTARSDILSIEAQYSNVDWAKLEAENPGQAANLRQKFATAYAQAQDAYKKAETAFTERQSQAMQQYRYENHQQLLEKVPEWKNPEVYRNDMDEMGQYLASTYGFTAQDLGAVSDWRHFDLIRKAFLYEKLKNKVETATQRIRAAPKQVLRAGKPQRLAQAHARQVQELENRAVQTGRSADRLAAARAIVQSSRQAKQR